DGAEPAANSVAASNLVRLARMLHVDAPEQSATALFGAFSHTLSHLPQGLPQMLGALAFFQTPPAQAVLAGNSQNQDFLQLATRLHREFAPFRVLLAAEEGPGRKWLQTYL